MKLTNIFNLLLLCLVLSGCNVGREQAECALSNERYQDLVQKYNIQTCCLTKGVDASKYDYLQPIETVEQLEDILMHLEEFFVFESHSVDNEISIDELGIPVLKSMSESLSVVVISDIADNGRTDVHLDIVTPAVITSAFYPTGAISPVFIGYEHLSGGVGTSGDRIYFTVNGDMIFKIAWEGWEVKRTPVTIQGYYDKVLQRGVITNNY